MAALLLTGVVTLPACGPGTGGTGVGPVNLSNAPPTIFYSGAVTVPLPSDPVALPGLTAPMTIPSAPLPGLLPQSTVAESTSATSPCIVNCSTATITLLLDGEAVQLQGQCFGFTSHVAFKIAVSGPTDVPGSFQTLNTSAGQTGTNSIDATLSLQFSNGQADSFSVTVSVRGSSGTLLLGPTVLSRVTAIGNMLPAGGGTNGALSCP